MQNVTIEMIIILQIYAFILSVYTGVMNDDYFFNISDIICPANLNETLHKYIMLNLNLSSTKMDNHYDFPCSCLFAHLCSCLEKIFSS